MGVFRHLDRSANMPAAVPTSGSPSLAQGQLCYLNAGRYAIAAGTRGVDLVEVTGHTLGQIEPFVAYTGGTGGDGIARGVEYNRLGKLMVMVEQEDGAPPTLQMKLRQYDLDTATLDFEHSFGDCVNAGPICYNGIDWWISYHSTLASNAARLLLVEIDGTRVTIKRNHAHTAFLVKSTPAADVRFTDVFYDGVFVWSLTSSFVARWDINGRLPPRNSWYGTADGASAPGTVHQGITTQRGSHYSIVSRT